MTNRMRVATSGRPSFADDYAVSGAPGQVLTRVAGPVGAPDDVEWRPGSGGLPIPSTSNIIFVSSVFGSDVTGTGTMNAPYATIAHAQLQVIGATAATPWDIVLLPGVYPENVHMNAFTRLVGWDSSKLDNITSAIQVNGTLDLANGFAAANAFVNVTNVQVAGAVTLDYPGVSGPTSDVSFTNCHLHGNLTVISEVGNTTELHECELGAGGDTTVSGGTVNMYNTSGISSLLHLIVRPRAATPVILNMYGGTWPGDLHADQDGLAQQVTVNSYGCRLGPMRLTAALGISPIVNSAFGDVPENPTLDGHASVALPSQIPVSRLQTVPSGTVIDALSSEDVLIPLTAGALGATSIESLSCTFTALGDTWNTQLVQSQLSWTFYVHQNGAVPEMHVVIFNPGAAIATTTEALPFLFYAFKPGNTL